MRLDEFYEFLRATGGVLAPLASLGTIAYIVMITYYLPKHWIYTSFVAWYTDSWHKSGVLTFIHSFRHEAVPIIGISLFMNVVGWGITSNGGRPMLFLDMSGTALCAILLGPWLAALTAILTPFLIALVFPHAGSEHIVSWLLVNLTGGVCWGIMARSKAFRRYFHRSETDLMDQIKSHLQFLIFFGIVAAFLMAIAGSIVAGEIKYFITPNTSFGVFVQEMFKTFQESLAGGYLSDMSLIGKKFATDFYKLAIYLILYIPDKMISAAIGLLGAKYIFPIYAGRLAEDEHEQYHDYNWLMPFFAGLIYLIMPASPAASSSYLIQYSPPVILAAAVIYEGLRRPRPEKPSATRVARLKSYKKGLKKASTDNFFSALVVAVLLAALVFISGLYFFNPIEAKAFARSFFRIILICLSAFYVLRLAIRQWNVLFDKDGGSDEKPRTPPDPEKRPRKVTVVQTKRPAKSSAGTSVTQTRFAKAAPGSRKADSGGQGTANQRTH